MSASISPDENNNAEPTIERPKLPPGGTFRKFGKLISERWPEYILEIVVVIIGITISFTISNLQNDAADRRLEEIYLAGLLEDISSDIDELEQVIGDTKDVVNSGRVLLEQSEMDELTIDRNIFVNHIRTVANRPSYVSKNATFTALKSTGYFNIIRDSKLLPLLFEYDQLYQGLKSLELAELQVVAAITGPYFIKSIPIADSLKTVSIIHEANLNGILHDLEFVNNVALRIGNRNELLEAYAETLNVATSIKKILQQNIVGDK